jgi:hypothetical protein
VDRFVWLRIGSKGQPFVNMAMNIWKIMSTDQVSDYELLNEESVACACYILA